METTSGEGTTSTAATPTVAISRDCSPANVPDPSSDTEQHAYPESPDNGTDRGIKSFVTDFERALVYNEFHDGTEDTFYVTFDDVSVVSRENSSVVHVSTVHMVEKRNGTPADRWYSVTYVLNSQGVRRIVETREAPPSTEDGDYVVTCTS